MVQMFQPNGILFKVFPSASLMHKLTVFVIIYLQNLTKFTLYSMAQSRHSLNTACKLLEIKENFSSFCIFSSQKSADALACSEDSINSYQINKYMNR